MARTDKTLLTVRDPWNSYTILHWAAKHGNVRLIDYLVKEMRLPVDVRSRGGYTPLMLAAMYNRTAAYYNLLNSGLCDPDLRDFSGRTAFQYLEQNANSGSGSETGSSDGFDEGDHVIEGKRQRMRKKVDKGSSFLRELVRRDSIRSSARSMNSRGGPRRHFARRAELPPQG